MPCTINKNLIPTDCKDVSIGGSTGRIWLMNKADWENSTLAKDVAGAITSVTFNGATGEILAYRIEMTKGSLVTGNPITRNDGGVSGLVHTITGVLPDLSMLQKASIESLFNQNVAVVIVETQAPKPAASAGGDSKSPPYLVYGDRSGLELSVTDTNLADQSVGNTIQFTLTTPTTSQLEIEYPINMDMSTADIEALEVAI